MEQDQEVGPGAVVSLRPGTATPAPRPRPAAIQPAPVQEVEEALQVSRKRIWDKNSFGFWLVVCILISLAFSFVYRALG